MFFCSNALMIGIEFNYEENESNFAIEFNYKLVFFVWKKMINLKSIKIYLDSIYKNHIIIPQN